MVQLKTLTLTCAVLGALSATASLKSADFGLPPYPGCVDPTNIESHQALHALNTVTDEPFERSPELSKLKSTCSIISPECITRVTEARASAEAVLPEHPSYWAAFRAYLRTSPPNCPWDDTDLDLSQPRTMEVTNLYRLRALIKSDRVSALSYSAALDDARNMLSNSENLMDWVIQVGVVGNLVQGMPRLVFEAAERGEPDTVAALLQAARPLSASELSVRAAFNGELRQVARTLNSEYSQSAEAAYQAQLRLRDQLAKRYPNQPSHEVNYIEPREFSQQMDQLRLHLEHLTELYAVLGELSELPHDRFFAGDGQHRWTEAAERARKTAPYDLEFDTYLRSYHGSVRLVDLSLALVRGLGGLYQTSSSELMPAHAPPSGFDWLRSDDGSQLCLTATTAYPERQPTDDICVVDWRTDWLSQTSVRPQTR